MSKSLARRDKVVFISLVDILYQLIFVLLIVVLSVYKDFSTLVTQVGSMDKTILEANQCKAQLNECRKQNLQACIPASKTSTVRSVIFEANSSGSLVFQGFSDDYYRYLKENDDKLREQAAKSIKPGIVMSVHEVEKKFSFVREDDCFHDFKLTPVKGMDSIEYSQLAGKLIQTFRRLSSD